MLPGRRGRGRGGEGRGRGGEGKKGRESKQVRESEDKWEELKTKLQFFKLKLCDYYSIYYQNNQPHFQAITVHKCAKPILIVIDFHKNYYFSQNANNI